MKKTRTNTTVTALTAVCISLLALFPATIHAAQNAANFTGDITLKRDAGGINTGIHFSDSTYQFSASPWSISGFNIFYNIVDGNVGIGTANPLFKLDVKGTVNASQFSGDGSALKGVALSNHNHDSSYWKTTGNAGTTPGTNFIGTTDDTALEIKVNNIRAIRIEPNATSPNIVSGYFGNVAGGSGVSGATVSGGGGAGFGINKASGSQSTVSGGISNTASGLASTISGGSTHYATGSYSTVCGGYYNSASGSFSTIGGGSQNTSVGGSTISGGFGNTASNGGSTISGGDWNTASGGWSAVSGGYQNIASGHYSWAGGRKAKTYSSDVTPTNHYGTFIWADSTNNAVGINSGQDFYSMANDEFAVRSRGGVRFVTAVDASGTPTKTTTIDSSGNLISQGSITAATYITSTSDIRLKTDIQPLTNTLDKVLKLRGVSYVMKSNETGSRKIGVIAQELEQEYPELVMNDDNGMKSVAYANLAPVLIEAIKALKVENDALKADLAEIRKMLATNNP
jgi:hypothetical protein